MNNNAVNLVLLLYIVVTDSKYITNVIPKAAGNSLRYFCDGIIPLRKSAINHAYLKCLLTRESEGNTIIYIHI